MKRPRPFGKALSVVILAVFLIPFFANSQNVIEGESRGLTKPEITVSEQQTLAWMHLVPELKKSPSNKTAQRVTQKIERHIQEFIDGFPWKPFHHTLGISGYETLFHHPDELIYSLSLCLPFLSERTASKTRLLLEAQAGQLLAGQITNRWFREGRPRESYEVPGKLRRKEPLPDRGGFWIYSLWAFEHYGGGKKVSAEAFRKILAATNDLRKTFSLDIHQHNFQNDEAESLNQDLAGYLGLYRLAGLQNEKQVSAQLLKDATRLLELRVNLERANPKILDSTKSSSKHLHHYKLARYCSLVPELARTVGQLSDGCAEANLKSFRTARNGWYMAFGDRLVGGENYTNPPHLSRALFTGAAMIENLSGEELEKFLDVPWCHGDFYFLEKCAFVLWALNGSRWITLP